MKRQLESLGHRVFVAETAAEALLMVEGPDTPDLLLIDVGLPRGMSGTELADAVRMARPRLPVIFMSGYTAAPKEQRRIRESGAALLVKPFTALELERAMSDAF